MHADRTMHLAMTSTLAAGTTHRLGAHANSAGVNFALVAPNADAVTLCLFNEAGEQTDCHAMAGCENGVWHGFLAGAGTGLIYGYRVHGEYAPQRGHRFNPAKLLLDPYAREVVGTYRAQDSFHGDDPTDTGPIALKGRIVDDRWSWGGDTAPRVPLEKTVLYEAHVRGLTRLHPGLPEALRGTYAGLGHPVMLDYLSELGVTAVNLLPIHARADEARLQKLGLSNYWGYSSIGFFAPEARYWSQQPGSSPRSEFRQLVQALHRRGIEVILDVVYNHTAETDAAGPTLSFRGIDNALYYHLRDDDLAQYENWTGCGNALNLSQPRVLQLVLDSLRYWVQEMHVDGFRFDLATVLGRCGATKAFDPQSAFFAAVMQDPVLSAVKLIAEPWDIGPGGYQLGRFPPGWQEWNDRYRDDMRRFWLRGDASVGQFAHGFAGSSELFRHDRRSPFSSVNFITSHDGFTLRDLLSYEHKHNQANGEHNRDGHHPNYSVNCGVEGASDNAAVVDKRRRLQRALLAMLLFSQGTPMLLAGDETGHSQQGNNNAYCQDNPSTWLDWQTADADLRAFVRRLIGLRAQLPALRHTLWHEAQSGQAVDIGWLNSSGTPMTENDWHDAENLMIRLNHREEAGVDCLLLINRSGDDRRFAVPVGEWTRVLCSADSDTDTDTNTNTDGTPDDNGIDAGDVFQREVLQREVSVPAHALMLAVSARTQTGG